VVVVAVAVAAAAGVVAQKVRKAVADVDLALSNARAARWTGLLQRTYDKPKRNGAHSTFLMRKGGVSAYDI